MTFVNLRYVEECTAEELSLDGIRKRAEAFNHTFEHNGGYKGYEAQAIDVLLAEVEKLKSIVARRDAEPRMKVTQAAEPSSKEIAKAIELLDDASGHLGFYDNTPGDEDGYDERADECLQWAMKEVDDALELLRGFKRADEPTASKTQTYEPSPEIPARPLPVWGGGKLPGT